jgi:hypothetical protein
MNRDAQTVEDLIEIAAQVLDGDESHKLRDGHALARRLARGEPEVVEQGVLMPKAATIPDGWSFEDVNNVGRFVGNWWGLRLRRGEPMVFQKGNVLLIRQFEFYSERDRGYYERISRIAGQTVLVVIGWHGRRSGYFAFEDGRMGPVTSGDAADVADWIVNWLEWALANPRPDWDKAKEGM